MHSTLYKKIKPTNPRFPPFFFPPVYFHPCAARTIWPQRAARPPGYGFRPTVARGGRTCVFVLTYIPMHVRTYVCTSGYGFRHARWRDTVTDAADRAACEQVPPRGDGVLCRPLPVR